MTELFFSLFTNNSTTASGYMASNRKSPSPTSRNGLTKSPFNSSKIGELLTLKYSQFLDMIKELNSIAEYFLDENGYGLSFSIAKGTDQSFLWKFSIRIECTKSKVGDPDIKSYRTLRLSQFVNIYNYIKNQTEALKVCQPEYNTHMSSSIMNDSHLEAAMIASQIIDNSKPCCSGVDSSEPYDMVKSIVKLDDETCCICMESKPNLILTCAHNFCEQCIKEWKITSKACPICRCISEESDCFVLAEKPDYFNIQEEISKSLFQITDGDRERANNYQTTNGQDDSDSSDDED